jgi:hypothetical protein
MPEEKKGCRLHGIALVHLRLQRTGFDRLNSGPDARIVPNGWFDLGARDASPPQTSTSVHGRNFVRMSAQQRLAGPASVPKLPNDMHFPSQPGGWEKR